MSQINIQLNFNRKTPLTDQIRDEIRRLIITGALEPGAMLPTVRELAERLDVNFNTTARAYRALDLEGLITTRQGRGTSVRTGAQKEAQEALSQLPSEENAVEPSQALDLLLDQFIAGAAQLGVSSEELNQALHQRLLVVKNQRSKKHSARVKIRRISGRKIRRDAGGAEWRNLRRQSARQSLKKRNIHPSMFHVKQ